MPHPITPSHPREYVNLRISTGNRYAIENLPDAQGASSVSFLDYAPTPGISDRKSGVNQQKTANVPTRDLSLVNAEALLNGVQLELPTGAGFGRGSIAEIVIGSDDARARKAGSAGAGELRGASAGTVGRDVIGWSAPSLSAAAIFAQEDREDAQALLAAFEAGERGVDITRSGEGWKRISWTPCSAQAVSAARALLAKVVS